MGSRFVKHVVTVAALAAAEIVSTPAQAQTPEHDQDASTSESFHPRFLGDLRALFLVRTDDKYFGHANAYSYPIDPAASGIELNLGGELLPRLALLASAHYAIDGADRDSARLRLQSGALLGVARWTFARVGDDALHFDAALQGGFGRYIIKETYVDPALSSQTYEQDDGAWGGMVGAQASLTISGIVAVAGYGFHIAPATVADRIDGTVQAGGNEISVGVGVWL